MARADLRRDGSEREREREDEPLLGVKVFIEEIV